MDGIVSSDEDEVVAPPPRKVTKIIEEDNDEDDQEEENEQKQKKRQNDEDSDISEDTDDSDDEDDEDSSEHDEEEASKTAVVDKDGQVEEPDADRPKDVDEEEEDEEDRRRPGNDTIYDFDIMMAKKKEENSKKRRRRGCDIINDNDDIIASIINQMREAVELDNNSNRNKQAATQKLKLLPYVMTQLRKIDLREAFLDSDILSVLTEWLAPLPDKSLPHINIRDSILKILADFNLMDVEPIKSSGIGKAVMYLYKHPRETRENKDRAKQLISCWSRPIFNLESNFSSMSREEREQRDLDLMSKHRTNTSQSKPKAQEKLPQKPGDPGWIGRARVPVPSMRDYVVRPQSSVNGDISRSSKKPTNMLEKYLRNQMERKRASRQQRAVNMKIDRA